MKEKNKSREDTQVLHKVLYYLLHQIQLENILDNNDSSLHPTG